MSETTPVLEYKCPCCDAGLTFGQESQKLKCAYCDNTFDLETVREYSQAASPAADPFEWEESKSAEWSRDEQETLQIFTCPSCAGELLTDDNTAATFCPFCGNPAIYIYTS